MLRVQIIIEFKMTRQEQQWQCSKKAFKSCIGTQPYSLDNLSFSSSNNIQHKHIHHWSTILLTTTKMSHRLKNMWVQLILSNP